ncbi:hypothetical protein HG537_0D01220 [Torulaspora globosa]|uniref:Protein PBN1 n=1 Tax=Torulaspora globosa TaxID=48254 RepID=A0A7H9HUU9_9SACH|nr:hypothetical protein HG537_0D01220 [Torulaspora sp. CBS 2947]
MGKFWLSLVVLLAGFSEVNGYRPNIRPKEKVTTSEQPDPWYRTIYGTKVELVTPTVIAGVTFKAKPSPTPNPLEPWITLNKLGEPKTVKPEIKNGITKKGSPDYSTYFKVASTTTLAYEDLKAHNMDPDEVYEEKVFIEEDKTYVSLNPVIRCTPDRYFNKGPSRDISSEPFCTPQEDVQWKVGKTYFASWYTHFFRDEHSDEVIDEVKVHLSYVKEREGEKGFVKRDIPATFFSSEWLRNDEGMLAIEVQPEWLQGARTRKVVLSVQPKNVPDEEFHPLDHGILLFIDAGSRVYKHTKEQLALEEAGFTERHWLFVAITMPTVVVIALILMYFFLYANNSYRDFSDITRKAMSKKHRVIGKVSEIKKFKNLRNHKYSELPSYQTKPDKQH